MSWLLTILGIAALIVLHEVGHFVVAKAVGMRVERFSLFFPPTIGRVRRGETEYAIGSIPAGGYVKITGMNPDELMKLDARVAPRAYYVQPPWKRIAVILAGPVMNLLITFLLFWIVLFSGSLDGASTLSNLNPHITTLELTNQIIGIERQPAAGVLQKGDRILTVDGHSATPLSIVKAIGSHHCAGVQRNGCSAQTPVELTLRRDGRAISAALKPIYEAKVGRMIVGVTFGAQAKAFGPLSAAATVLDEMWGTTTGLIENLGRAFTSSTARHQISSIVGITEVTQQAVTQGAGYALVILGFVSLALAVMNLFPFLPLDGGHVLWSVAEKLRGRRVSITAMWRFSSIGILMLIFLVINGFSNDIGRLSG